MNEKKRNTIPAISPERLDLSACNTELNGTKEEQVALAFVKGKEVMQPFTIRMPKTMYQEIRQVAFYKNIKINQIIVGLIKDYLKQH